MATPASAAERATSTERGTIDVLRVDDSGDLSAPHTQRDALDAVEGGGIVLLPTSGFQLSDAEQRLLADLRNFLTRPPETANGRPTIIFDPARGHIKKFNYAFAGWRPVRAEIRDAVLPDLERMMVRFGHWADDLIAALLPRYLGVLGRDRVTYRPNQRSAVQPLHVDSAYGYPTQGRGMLRIFCNIDPLQRPRVWHVGEPFEDYARRFLPAVRPRRRGPVANLLSRLGVVNGSRTPYDETLAELRRLGKHDAGYQRSAPRRVVEFPPGSAWIAITDLVLHGAISGQHSLDQTFLLPPGGMQDPKRSSLQILERLSGRHLV